MNPLINNDFHPHYMFEQTHSKQSTHHQAVWIKVTWWLCSHRVICRNRTYFLFYVTFSQLHRTMWPILFQAIYLWFPWKTAHNAFTLNFVLNKQYPHWVHCALQWIFNTMNTKYSESCLWFIIAYRGPFYWPGAYVTKAKRLLTKSF